MKHLTPKTMIVVADEEKALLLENRGTALVPDLHLALRIDTEALLSAQDRSAWARDHAQDTTAPQDYHRMAGATLAAAVASQLEAARAGQGFDALVLVAPPQVLGALRAAMGEALRADVLAEMPKTLTGHPLPHIAELVTEALAGS